MLNKITLYDFKTDPIGDAFVSKLKTLSKKVHIVLSDGDYSGNLKPEDLQGSDAFLTCVFDHYPNTLFKGTSIRYIGSTHTDMSDFDVEHLKKLGITLTNVPAYCSQTIAELTFGVLLSIARELPTAFAHTKNNKWDFQSFSGFELAGKKLGVIGMGHIGQIIVRIAHGFDMNVSYYSRNRKPKIEQFGVSYRELPDLVADSEIITLHSALNQETEALLDQKLINLMDTGTIVLNPSRAELIDFKPMYQRCRNSEIILWMDELHEPVWRDKFRVLDNVFLTPDFGWYTKEAQSRLRNITMQNIQSFIDGDVINSI